MIHEWLLHFPQNQPVGWTLLVLSGVATLGLWLGKLRWRGLGLGSAGVLFAGILLGHFGVTIDPGWLGLIREFGLILFVYTIGLQVGPGFFNSLKQQGLVLNSLAAGIVLAGALLAILMGKLGGFNMAVTAGLFAGATTNTPALAAIQEALHNLPGIDAGNLSLPALGYAVAYPFGIFGILLTMLLVRAFFRIDVHAEAAELAQRQRGMTPSLERRSVIVRNADLKECAIREIPGIREGGVVVSRILPESGHLLRNAQASTKIHQGDVLLAVGNERALDKFVAVVGEVSQKDLLETGGLITSDRVLVTSKNVYGRSLRELALSQKHDVTITRLTRGDLELPADAAMRLQFGDLLLIVGSKENVSAAAKTLGNSIQELSQTNFIPVFIGIGLGILLGSIPMNLPGMPSAVRLGLAGGPLLVAILLSHLGRVGPVVWYMPPSANLALRELGIILFLGCVGLKAGAHFVGTLVHGPGLQWMAAGMVITFVPLLLAGWAARVFFKQPFTNICGLLSGSMTDPPALAFANSIVGNDSPSVAYATVYPLTMLLRIVVAQVLILAFTS